MAVVMAAVMVAVVKRDEEKQVFDTREREREHDYRGSTLPRLEN